MSPKDYQLVASCSQSRGNERNARLLSAVLSSASGPDAVMVGVLVIALFLGLLGVAVHVLWIVAIVMAFGLGFAAQSADEIDVVHQLPRQPR